MMLGVLCCGHTYLLLLLSLSATETATAFRSMAVAVTRKMQSAEHIGFLLASRINPTNQKYREWSTALGLSASAADLNSVVNNSTEMKEWTKDVAAAGGGRRSLDMPWNELQEWALQDRLGKYTITLPITVDGAETMRSYTLWRALSEDSIELAGYPLSFLVQRYSQMSNNDSKDVIKTSPEILPFLDDFVFEPTGGMSGRIYGITGVADGTRIQTTPVADVQATIPKRFVRTADGQIIYELGKPSTELDIGGYSLDSGKMAERAAASLQSTTSGLIRTAQEQQLQQQGNNDQLIDSDLINLAGLTGVVLAGAYAFESLSHHLTVNMFWV